MTRLESVLQSMKNDQRFMRNVSDWTVIPPRSGSYSELPEDLDSQIRDALHKRGIQQLYSHQKQCYELIRNNRDIVVVTPTASGKTLCYNLPVLQHLKENPHARALYLFPTKALSQDQQSALNDIVLSKDLPVKIFTFDGDTPAPLRTAARKQGQIIISNPDMLHAGILPNHTKWVEFFKSVQYIVIDEVHIYRGIFGAHVTNVIRRLKRIAAFYGSNPVFICCSATIGNPAELAEKLTEKKMSLVDTNGAPAGEKQLIFYNPPLVDPVQGIRKGVVNEGSRQALNLLKSGIKTIVFTRSRVRTELIASYINKSLENVFTDNSRIKVEAYRGGYLPSERRAIERGLREGSIQGVVSTNALELGIDIGGLDAAVLAGIPASTASVWQQAGRAGRSGSVSVALIIATSSPVNQYLMRHPEFFEKSSPESAYLDPDNIFILMDHLKCAVFELPFEENERFGGEVTELLDHLEEQGLLRLTGGRYYWADRAYPAEQVSLRSGVPDNIVIVDITQGKRTVIGEMDQSSAREMLFPDAVYIHRGEQYIVKTLNLDDKYCEVEQKSINYYTDSILKTDIKVLSEDDESFFHNLRLVFGDVLVRTDVAKYKKIRFRSHENIGYGDIFLPQEEFHTRACMILFQEESGGGRVLADMNEDEKASVLARLGTLIKKTAPLFLLCSSGDIGVAPRVRDPHFHTPSLYVYDNYSGGIGLSEGLEQQLPAIIAAAAEQVDMCSCQTGCPSCVGPESDDLPGGTNPRKLVHTLLGALM